MPEGEAIFDILRRISKRDIPVDYGLPDIANSDPVPFSVNNFHPIGELQGEKICFVDGGNNIIYLAPGHGIHMVRLYHSIFRGDEKVNFGRYTFILDATYDPEVKKYLVDVYDIDDSGLFDGRIEVDETSVKDERIKGIGAYVRRIGEWLLMERIMDDCDYIVRDGSLQTGEREEYVYQERVFEKTRGIIGISKTCSLMTTRGFSIVAAVNHLAMRKGVKAPWYYHPIAKNISTIRGEMFVVKLHPLSEYAFRAEIYPAEEAEDILASLVPHSNDPIFLGYPYGLIDADINARISDEEIKMYRTMIYDYMDEFSVMEMNALNAHDRISEVK